MKSASRMKELDVIDTESESSLSAVARSCKMPCKRRELLRRGLKKKYSMG